MNQLDLLDIRTCYRQWIHYKACDRRCVVISIGPDPILNKLESGPGIYHWTLNRLQEFRQDFMSPLKRKTVLKDWFYGVFENSQNVYVPPSFETIS